MGEVLDTAFGLFRNQFVVLVTISAAMQIVPGVLGVYLEVSGGLLTHPMLNIFHLFLAFLFGSIAVAASTYVVAGAYLGNRIAASDAIMRSLGLVGTLVLLSILTGLVIMFGFMLLIIPGLILIGGLALGNAIVVLEAPIGATAAMQRSWQLTKGARTKVLVTILLASLLQVIPATLVGLLAAIITPLALWPAWVVPVLTLALTILVHPFLYVVVIVLYYDMRVRKEGYDLELMAQGAGAI